MWAPSAVPTQQGAPGPSWQLFQSCDQSVCDSAAVARHPMLLSPLHWENRPGTWKCRPPAALVLLFVHLTAPWNADGVSCPLADSVRRRVVRRPRILFHYARSAALAPDESFRISPPVLMRSLAPPRSNACPAGGWIDGSRIHLYRVRHGVRTHKRLNFPAGHRIQQPRGLRALQRWPPKPLQRSFR